MRKALFAVMALVLSLLAGAPLASAEWDVADQTLLKAVRARFEGLSPQQVAEAGYESDSFCVGTPSGMMGFHAQKEPFNDDNVVRAWDPEILLLDQNGAVIGLEYETWDTKVARPSLFGLDFALSPGHPGREWPHYMLHIHLRPGGAYFVGDFNPDRRCPPASATPMLPATRVMKLSAPVGGPPSQGWRWLLAELRNGSQPRTDGPHDHTLAWLFYLVEGSGELASDGQSAVMAAGDARWVPAGQEHTHVYGPSSRLLALRLGRADEPVGRVHGGELLFAPDTTLGLAAGTDHLLHVAEHSLAPGARLGPHAMPGPTMGYVVAGVLTAEVSGAASRVEAGQVFEWPSRTSHAVRNDGSDPVRFTTFTLVPQQR